MVEPVCRRITAGCCPLVSVTVMLPTPACQNSLPLKYSRDGELGKNKNISHTSATSVTAVFIKQQIHVFNHCSSHKINYNINRL